MKLPPGVTPDPPGPGQESVWDYPRPPSLEPAWGPVSITVGGTRVAQSKRAWMVKETSHPPNVYIPPADVNLDLLRPSKARATHCEWKGRATYFDLILDGRKEAVAWTYQQPTPAFAAIKDHLGFYAIGDCLLDGQPVTPQPGGFYGGWITDRVVGPFKGGPGSWGW